MPWYRPHVAGIIGLCATIRTARPPGAAWSGPSWTSSPRCLSGLLYCRAGGRVGVMIDLGDRRCARVASRLAAEATVLLRLSPAWRYPMVRQEKARFLSRDVRQSWGTALKSDFQLEEEAALVLNSDQKLDTWSKDLFENMHAMSLREPYDCWFAGRLPTVHLSHELATHVGVVMAVAGASRSESAAARRRPRAVPRCKSLAVVELTGTALIDVADGRVRREPGATWPAQLRRLFRMLVPRRFLAVRTEISQPPEMCCNMAETQGNRTLRSVARARIHRF